MNSKKKTVVQHHTYGCSVACVAYILGVSYLEAQKLFDHPEFVYDRGYYCNEIVDVLQRGGMDYEYKKITPKTLHLIDVPYSIVYLKKSKQLLAGHYIVRTDCKTWMNPWGNMPCIVPAKAAFQEHLIGEPQWVIFPLHREGESKDV